MRRSRGGLSGSGPNKDEAGESGVLLSQSRATPALLLTELHVGTGFSPEFSELL